MIMGPYSMSLGCSQELGTQLMFKLSLLLQCCWRPPQDEVQVSGHKFETEILANNWNAGKVCLLLETPIPQPVSVHSYG